MIKHAVLIHAGNKIALNSTCEDSQMSEGLGGAIILIPWIVLIQRWGYILLAQGIIGMVLIFQW